MPMRGALANPGEGVVGRVRPPARLLRRARPRGQPSSGHGWPAVEAGGAMPRLGLHLFHPLPRPPDGPRGAVAMGAACTIAAAPQ
jgi:hypothetical protein